jgi:alanine racemase
MSVVKANAYGHGLVEASKACERGRASGLAVAILEEGATLRDAGVALPILLLGLALPEQAPDIVRYGLEAVVSDSGLCEALSRAAVSQCREAVVHLKVDTGMCRVGVEPPEVLKLAQRISSLPGLRLAALSTHFTSADTDPEAVREETRLFDQAARTLASAGFGDLKQHLAASAAGELHPSTRRQMVRAGLLTYGVPPRPGAPLDGLTPALQWKARITQVRRAAPGATVSYGRTHTLTRDSLLGLLPVGYADGWPRSLSGRGTVLVGGGRAPVLGRVCMDQCVVDLTGLGPVAVGDEAVLLGIQGDQCQTVDHVAAQAGTIAHEILSRLGARLHRVYA